MNLKPLSKVLVFFLAGLFLLLPASLQAKELDLDSFFQINPNEIQPDTFDRYISKPWVSMNENDNRKLPDYDDYRKSALTVNGHKATIIVGKASLNKTNRIVLLLKVSYERGCRWFLDKAINQYGREVFHYYDSDESSFDMSVNAEASFEYSDHRVRLECSEIILTQSKKTIVSMLKIVSGHKDTISQTLPRTLVHCKEQQVSWNVDIKKIPPLKKHIYSIDHDDKKLLLQGNRSFWSKVLEFSNNYIRVQHTSNKNAVNIVGILSINRLTGSFEEQRVISTEGSKKFYGKDPVMTVSGQCEKIEAKKKF